LLFFIGLINSSYSQDSKRQNYLDSINHLNVVAFNLQNTNIDSALELNLSLYPLLNTYPDSMTLSNLLSVTGGLYQKTGLYTKAIPYFIDCLVIREQLGNKDKLGKIQLNLANTYHLLKQDVQAINYGKKAIHNMIAGNSSLNTLMNAYNTLGASYMKINLDSAEHYLSSGWKLITPDGISIGSNHIDLLGNLGAVHEQKSEFQQALHYHLVSDSIQQSIGDSLGLIWTKLHLGIVYMHQKKFSQSKNSLAYAYRLARSQSDLENQTEISDSFVRLYLKWNRPAEAYNWFITHDSLRDALTSYTISESIAEKQAEYEVAQKDAEIAASKAENQKLDAERKQATIQNYALLALLTIGLGAALLLFRNYKQKQYISSIELNLKEQRVKELEKEQQTASYIAHLEGQEKERQRIAQDLHDQLGNTMAALRLSLQKANTKSTDDKLELVDLAVSEIRNVSYNLSSAILKRHGFNAALQELKTLVERTSTLSFHLYLSDQVIELSDEALLEIYRIIQELTSNALKHANASEISLQTTVIDGQFNLIFEDNGKGFRLDEVNSGMGIENIKIRSNKLKGNCTYDSQPGRGTIVILNVPTQQNA
jgi:signal transduction histidine kinase